MNKVLIAMMASMMALTACTTNGGSVGADAMGRSIPERLSDTSIELTARRNLATIDGINQNNARIAIDGYLREVLLTGEVPSEQIKAEIGRTIESMRGVAKVFNYLTVTDIPKSQSHTVHENYLRSKINARLLANRDVKSSQYKIIVRDSTAYIMGYLTSAQQDEILAAVQATSGMAKAVTLTTLVEMAPAVEDLPAVDGATGSYTLQEIYTPDATNTAPSNTPPVFGTPSE
ncbi:Osmotically-inducible protein OsmY, contains BON domain [Moraxella cuniculi DSM 21768]|uniref:Osmotically-inducible protein OsmY, contains BON domain n=1 Tax=Moraxella cuniculi DSM 21768 TaxID=1122245 RepID=A0A1N7FR13_9GAMM|nr:BON domain-containing protein [Moraxella cuniculi]SIS02812.1 Osmotically-inducible protein OsmY, contains BON domain [Moraxella cuniculi DSM 21768]